MIKTKSFICTDKECVVLNTKTCGNVTKDNYYVTLGF